MSVRVLAVALIAVLTLVESTHAAATYKWTGMRNPCKLSAQDGLNEKQLSRKIGAFITLNSADEWTQAIFNVNNRFPGSKPWVTWAVGNLKGATALSDEVHEAYLTHMDKLGVEVYLEVWPSGADVEQLIDSHLAKYKHHPSVAGFGVDLEYFKGRATDELAKSWDESFISGMKRTCGSTLAARSEPALKIEAGLKALAYAIRR